MNFSEHFASYEFDCKCGCNTKYTIDGELIEKLEKLFTIMNCSEIVITSGFRCSEHSVAVGGSSDDAHTHGIACDIICFNKNKEKISSDIVAENAEKVGFSGIGIISETAVHVDVRNSNNYKNSHWFGDERTGNDNIVTFIKNDTISYELTINGKTIKGVI